MNQRLRASLRGLLDDGRSQAFSTQVSVCQIILRAKLSASYPNIVACRNSFIGTSTEPDSIASCEHHNTRERAVAFLGPREYDLCSVFLCRAQESRREGRLSEQARLCLQRVCYAWVGRKREVERLQAQLQGVNPRSRVVIVFHSRIRRS